MYDLCLSKRENVKIKIRRTKWHILFVSFLLTVSREVLNEEFTVIGTVSRNPNGFVTCFATVL